MPRSRREAKADLGAVRLRGPRDRGEQGSRVVAEHRHLAKEGKAVLVQRSPASPTPRRVLPARLANYTQALGDRERPALRPRRDAFAEDAHRVPAPARTSWPACAITPSACSAGRGQLAATYATTSATPPGPSALSGSPMDEPGHFDRTPEPCHRETENESWPRFEQRLAVSFQLLPDRCPGSGSGTTPAPRWRPARPVTRALWGWR
jgi:hypothetical protein